MISLCTESSGQSGNSRNPAVRIAAHDWEVRQALELVYYAYLRAGFIPPNRHRRRVTPYHLLPTTQVLVSVLDGEVISTTTLIADGESGLPMEELYADEINMRRQAGLRLAEVSCLADRRQHVERSFSALVQLMSLTAQAALYQDIDQLLIAVHPHHSSFYERFFGFELIGKTKSYEAVNNNPAVPYALDLRRVRERCPRGHRRLFGTQLPEAVLVPQELSDDLRLELGEVLDQSADMYLEDEVLTAVDFWSTSGNLRTASDLWIDGDAWATDDMWSTGSWESSSGIPLLVKAG